MEGRAEGRIGQGSWLQGCTLFHFKDCGKVERWQGETVEGCEELTVGSITQTGPRAGHVWVFASGLSLVEGGRDLFGE